MTTKTEPKVKIRANHLIEIGQLGGEISVIYDGLSVKFHSLNCDFVSHKYSYGGDNGEWEIMPDPDTLNDVRGHLTLDEAIKAVLEIKSQLDASK